MTDLRCYRAPGPEEPDILLNLSFAQPYVADTLNDATLLNVFATHERIHIREYWDEALLPKSKAGEWIVALDTVRGRDGQPAPAHLLNSALQKQAETNLRGRALFQHLRSMSLEDQRRLVLALLPEGRDGLQGLLRDTSFAFAPDFRAMFLELATPKAFVKHLLDTFRRNTAPMYHPRRYFELLTLLWSANLVLFPLDLRTWNMTCKWAVLRNERYTGQKASLVSQVTQALKGSHITEFQGWAYTQLASSTLVTAKDLSLTLIRDYETRLIEMAKALGAQTDNSVYSYKSSVARVAQTFRLLFNQAHPELAVAETRTPKKLKVPELVRTDGKFLWLEHARPALSEWADLMRKYVAQLTTARIVGQVGKLNYFADYLLTLDPSPASPLAVSRSQHIYDATRRNAATYTEYLKTRTTSKTQATTTLSQLRSFFDWYADYLLASGTPESAAFKNPVLASDSLGQSHNGEGQTARNSLPGYILEELKALLVENDFAFGKSMKTAYVRVIDSHTGKPVRVWFPAPTVCLYLMLEAPLRGHQGRWMDSGELDEFVYDPTSNSLIRNTSANAIQGRRESALRLQHDSLRKASWLGLWVNTNKTVLYDSAEVGYCIPYVSDKLAELLNLMRAWQKRYLSDMTAPLPYYDNKQGIAERKRVEGKGPQVTPLFRDPLTLGGAPIRYTKLVTFYTRVLAEVQARIKRKHGHDLQLVEEADGELKWLVDLHSLRVSGITAMIENGVPLEVVSQFVAGHATLVMTLHYLKYSPLKLWAILKAAHEKSLKDMDFVGSEVFMENLDSFAPFMLGQDGPGQGAGLSVLREKTGILTINLDGICPGTSCSTGGPVDTTTVHHGPVPGGQRCGLCRYWITGPAHLLGQVAAVNNLAYAIRKKGLQVATLNDERLDAEDAGDQKKARQLRDRVDVLNRELAIDVEEWAARYRYAEQSVAQLDAYLKARASVEGTSLTVPLLTAGTAAELKVTLEEAHEFALLDQITQMSEFVTGFKNREAELEKSAILSRMMATNGIKPFLLTLNEQQAREAGNLLSAVLLQQVRTQELDDVLTGKKPLTTYPQLFKTMQLLEDAVKNGGLPSVFTLEATLLPSLVQDEPTEEQDEVKFA
jgi:hypothetical protein